MKNFEKETLGTRLADRCVCGDDIHAGLAVGRLPRRNRSGRRRAKPRNPSRPSLPWPFGSPAGEGMSGSVTSPGPTSATKSGRDYIAQSWNPETAAAKPATWISS